MEKQMSFVSYLFNDAREMQVFQTSERPSRKKIVRDFMPGFSSARAFKS